ncbi:MAG: hypothetical protein RLZZ602_2174, partial [Pseudomonadota bacterium]
MAQLIGIVTKLTGVVYARDAEGNLRELSLSSEVFQGETLVTAQGSIVEVTVPDAPPIVVPGARELLLNGEVTLAGRNTAEDAMLAEESLDALVAALEGGEGDLLTGEGDLFDELGLEATAAGGAGGEGSSFVRLGRIGYDLTSGEPIEAGSAESEQNTDTSAFDADLQLLANDSPVANNDLGATDFETPVTVSVLSNDFDANDDPVSVAAVVQPENGSVTINDDGTITYTPNAGFSGEDSFTYTLVDENGAEDTATVTITVAEEVAPLPPPVNEAPPPPPPVNEAPDAVDDAVTTDFQTPVSGSVLPNDSDPEGNALTITGNTLPASGTLVFNADGTFTYTPNEGFSGSDSFTYTIADGNGGTDTATVTISVGEAPPPPPPVNEAPDAVDDAVTTDFQTPVSGSVLPNDSDPEGDALTITGNTLPASGSLVFNADGTFIYTPNEGFSGSDSFTYTIADGNGGTDTATVTIDVAPQPPAVEFAVADAVVSEGDTVTLTITRSGNTGVEASVDIASLAVAAGIDTAEANDFTALGATTVSFAAGVTSQTITIQTTADNVYEGAETFRVGLSNATAGGNAPAVITNDTAQVTILDDGTGPDPEGPEGPDDDTPVVNVSGPVSVNEGDGVATFTISLSNASE